MRGNPAWGALALAAGGCIVGTLDLSGFACDEGAHPCTSGYSCVFTSDAGLGTCVAEGSSSGGGSSGGGGTTGGSSGSGSSGGPPCSGAPTCAAGGGLLLCDGGLQPCGPGLTCDYGSCWPRCSPGQGCAADAACDAFANACLPTSSCSADGGACPGDALCLSGVCTPAPPPGGSVGSCALPGDGGAVLVEGPVALFPNADADPSLENGGTVTFFTQLADGGVWLLNPVPIVAAAASFPSYSITLPAGSWTALVQQPGRLVPTYFPGLEIRAPQGGGSAQLPLAAALDVSQLPAVPGGTPQAGHIYWLGRAANCATPPGYLGGYTVGLSPAPPALGYLDLGSSGSQLQVDPALASSSSSLGEFLAEDAPYATTQYALAIGGGSEATVLLNGTFVPPPYSAGQDIAVALIYPNFTP